MPTALDAYQATTRGRVRVALERTEAQLLHDITAPTVEAVLVCRHRRGINRRRSSIEAATAAARHGLSQGYDTPTLKSSSGTI